MYKQRYKNMGKQVSYENACDQHRWGLGTQGWVYDPKLTTEERSEVYRLAFWDTAEGDIEHGKMVNDVYHFFPVYA